MRHYVKLVFLAFSLLLTIINAGCGIFNALEAPSVHNLNVSEANDMINDNLENQNFVILDVRTPGEYAAGHIANAVNVDVEAADFTVKITAYDKDKTYLVYCRSGRRSLTAAGIMIKQGFRDVYNMLAGITEWQAAGYPVVK